MKINRNSSWNSILSSSWCWWWCGGFSSCCLTHPRDNLLAAGDAISLWCWWRWWWDDGMMVVPSLSFISKRKSTLGTSSTLHPSDHNSRDALRSAALSAALMLCVRIGTSFHSPQLNKWESLTVTARLRFLRQPTSDPHFWLLHLVFVVSSQRNPQHLMRRRYHI